MNRFDGLFEASEYIEQCIKNNHYPYRICKIMIGNVKRETRITFKSPGESVFECMVENKVMNRLEVKLTQKTN